VRLQGKVALIVGGTSGIGLAIAQRYGKEGAAVVVASRSAAAVERTVALLRAEGAQADGVTCDIRHAHEVEQAVRYVLDRFGQFDIAVASAGTGDGGTTATETDEETWQRVIDVNLKGVFLLAKYAIPAMESRGGVIIPIASQLGLVGARNEVALCAAKGGVVNMTRALALDCAPMGIRVNCICPAAVETPMLKAWFQSQPDPGGFRAEWTAHHPLGRLGEPEDIAGAAVFLASDDATWITGVILPVDGGFVAQ
jgi:NAD(P)-dependent dehydrogenase (short-subunit alcohol dehydrogenase family)